MGCAGRRTYFHDVFDRKPDSVYVYVFLWGVQAGELIFMMCLTGKPIVCMFMCFCGVCRQEAGTGQSRLVLGMFTIFPAFGIIPPNSQQTITVDCVAESQGRADEVCTLLLLTQAFTSPGKCLPFLNSVWLWGVFFFTSLLVSAGSFTVFCWSW